jgi:hypothetical protein
LLTALASFHPLAQTIPAWMMGYSILKRETTLLPSKCAGRSKAVFFCIMTDCSKKTTYSRINEAWKRWLRIIAL